MFLHRLICKLVRGIACVNTTHVFWNELRDKRKIENEEVIQPAGVVELEEPDSLLHTTCLPHVWHVSH